MHSLGRTLLAFVLLHSILQGQIACYSRYFLTSYFCIPAPYNEKDISFGVLVLEDLVGILRTLRLQLFSITGWGIDLDYCDTEWFALETNRGHFETTPKYCISDSFVDYDGYSISSKEINRNLIKDLLSMAPNTRTRPCIPLSQSIPSGSFHKSLILLYQREDRLKITITEK